MPHAVRNTVTVSNRRYGNHCPEQEAMATEE